MPARTIPFWPRRRAAPWQEWCLTARHEQFLPIKVDCFLLTLRIIEKRSPSRSRKHIYRGFWELERMLASCCCKIRISQRKVNVSQLDTLTRGFHQIKNMNLVERERRTLEENFYSRSAKSWKQVSNVCAKCHGKNVDVISSVSNIVRPSSARNVA